MEKDSNCQVCNKTFDRYPIKHVLQCSSCNLFYHTECTKVRNPEKLKNVRRALWKCESCPDSDEEAAAEGGEEVADLKTMLQSVMKKQDTLLSQNKDMMKKLQKMDNLEVLVREYKEALDVKVEQLEAENKSLRSYTEKLEERIEDLEQRSRICNIEITGLPETKGEDPVLAAAKIGETLGIPNAREKILVAHRVPSTRSPKPLIVNLATRVDKVNWLQKYKNTRLTCKQVSPSLPDTRLYLNEHLAPHNKKLLKETKDFAKEKNFKYVWVREGKVFLRKAEGHKIFKIRCESDLLKLVTE